MTTLTRSSVAFSAPVWQKLKEVKNRSAVVNEALELFFERKEFLQTAEKAYWERVEASVRLDDGAYLSVTSAPDGSIDANSLSAALWK